MTTYRVTVFTKEDYNKFMCGSYNYNSEYVYVEANNEQEALLKARKTGYVVHEYSAKTLQEIQEEEERIAKRMKNL